MIVPNSLLVPGSRVAIVGSRDFDRPDLVASFVRSLPSGVVVVSGGARGVDRFAVDEARRCGLEVDEFLAQWVVNGRFRKWAGCARNASLVASGISCLVAFPLSAQSISSGTANAIKEAHKRNIPVFVISK